MESTDSVRMARVLRLCRKLQTTTFRRQKLELLERFLNKGMLKKVFALVMDPQVQFGLTSSQLEPYINFKLKTELIRADKRFATWVNRLTDLAEGKLSSTDAVSTLVPLFKKSTYEERHLMLSILDKSLNLGVDFAMAQKIFGKDFIKLPEDFMKAGMFNPDLDIEFPVLVEPCIDGERFKLIVSPSGECKAYDCSFADNSRLFKSYYPSLIKRSQRLEQSLEVDVMVIYRDWSHTFACLHTRGLSYEQQWEQLDLFVLDVIVGGNTNTPYSKRRDRAASVAATWKKNGLKAQLIPAVEADSFKAVRKLVKSCREPKGIILKDPQSKYVRKRDSYWLKVRPASLERFSARVEELILAADSNPNSLCGLVLRGEDGKKVILKQFRGESQRLIVAEVGGRLVGRAVEYMKDGNGEPLFCRMRPHRTVNG